MADQSVLAHPVNQNKIIEGRIERPIIPGDHNEIIREPRVRILGEQMRQILENAHREKVSRTV